MISRRLGSSGLPSKALAWTLGLGIFTGSNSPARADGPGFYGFGLGYHLGYGYGGKALGVSPDGGYPFYGGPGYLHCEPPLRRLGHIVPFAYYGGPGYPSPGQPQYFGGVGPLVPNESVVTLTSEYGNAELPSGYGPFNGALPSSDTYFSPNAAQAVQSRPTPTPTPRRNPDGSPASPTSALIPGPGRSAGIDAEPVVVAGGVRGMKVSRIHPGSAAEKAGLQAGDVIQSINGYVTTQGSNLAWIIANAAPDDVLKMTVRAAADGRERTVTALLR